MDQNFYCAEDGFDVPNYDNHVTSDQTLAITFADGFQQPITATATNPLIEILEDIHAGRLQVQPLTPVATADDENPSDLYQNQSDILELHPPWKYQSYNNDDGKMHQDEPQTGDHQFSDYYYFPEDYYRFDHSMNQFPKAEHVISELVPMSAALEAMSVLNNYPNVPVQDNVFYFPNYMANINALIKQDYLSAMSAEANAIEEVNRPKVRRSKRNNNRRSNLNSTEEQPATAKPPTYYQRRMASMTEEQRKAFRRRNCDSVKRWHDRMKANEPESYRQLMRRYQQRTNQRRKLKKIQRNVAERKQPKSDQSKRVQQPKRKTTPKKRTPQQLERQRLLCRLKRANETPEEREIRLAKHRECDAKYRAKKRIAEAMVQQENRLRIRQSRVRNEKREIRLEKHRRHYHQKMKEACMLKLQEQQLDHPQMPLPDNPVQPNLITSEATLEPVDNPNSTQPRVIIKRKLSTPTEETTSELAKYRTIEERRRATVSVDQEVAQRELKTQGKEEASVGGQQKSNSVMNFLRKVQSCVIHVFA